MFATPGAFFRPWRTFCPPCAGNASLLTPTIRLPLARVLRPALLPPPH